ncbi:SDR family NAD(P)-dependent oxidoreductase [Desulfonatronospira sp.]|uniref:SDR family NAD(P)-dependent oxidoreductase n=1 Tax=Desulfonatronospira sp. TaxID=1962951 RepID=UPI0025BF51B9|nr:SDR family NAD(P)-dependent oxidoreductase [Desulfonatronospira sp.]
MAGVNSFGFGGTNAHVLLEESIPSNAQNVNKQHTDKPPPLFISARSENSLKNLARAYAHKIRHSDPGRYCKIAYSAATGRDHLRYRLVADTDNLKDIAAGLQAFSQDDNSFEGCIVAGESAGEKVGTAFVFSGNGSQWPGMAADLLKDDPHFSSAVDEVDDLLGPMLGWSVRKELQKPPEAHRLYLTEVSQPLLFAVQIGLVGSMQHKGISADTLCGHSVGEVAAACASRALTLEQGCRVIYYRSRLQGRTKGLGGMAAVNISPEEAYKLDEVKSGGLEVSAINTPGSVTLTGEAAYLQQVETRLLSQGVFFKKLDIDYAFHSRLMESLKKDLYYHLHNLQGQDSALEFVSTVTGKAVPGTELDADYWWSNIREPVNFSAAVGGLIDRGVRVFIEIGPHGVLQHYIHECGRIKNVNLRRLPTLNKHESGTAALHRAWRKAYVSGCNPVAHQVFPGSSTWVDLPGYPWDRTYCARQHTPESLNFLSGQTKVHPLLGTRHKDALLWEQDMDTLTHPWLAHHVVGQQPVFPAAAYLETALAAACNHVHRTQQEIENISFLHFLFLPPDSSKILRTSIEPEEGFFRIQSRTRMSDESWNLHCTGKITSRVDLQIKLRDEVVDAPESFGRPLDIQDFYQRAAGMGLDYGHSFRVMNKAWIRPREILAQICPGNENSHPGMHLCPFSLDGAFQSLLALSFCYPNGHAGRVYLPTWIKTFRLLQQGRVEYSRAVIDKVSSFVMEAKISFMDKKGNVLAVMEGCRFSHAQSLKRLYRPPEKFVVKPLAISPWNGSSAPLRDAWDIHEEVVTQVACLGESLDTGTYNREVQPLVNAALLSGILETLQKAGRTDKPLSIDEFMLRLKIKPEHRYYLGYVLRLLVADDLAVEEQGGFRLSMENELFPSDQLCRTIVRDYPAYLAEASVVSTVVMHLKEVLQGYMEFSRLPGMDSSKGGTPHFFSSYTAGMLNLTLRHIVGLVQRDSDNAGMLKILSLEDGSGVPLAHVMPVLPANRFEYVTLCSDEAQCELMQKRASDRPELKFEQLDLQNMQEKHFQSLGQFHLILAHQALHASDNLGQALSNCYRLLHPGGCLILSELSPTPCNCLILGLDPAFWKFSSHANTPSPRLMPDKHWKKAMEKAGFKAYQASLDQDAEEPECFTLIGAKPAASSQDLHDLVHPLEPAQEKAGTVRLVIGDAASSEKAGILSLEISRNLQNMGLDAVRIECGPGLAFTQEDPCQLNPLSAEQWEEFLLYWSKNGIALEIITLMGLDENQDPAHEEFSRLLQAGTVCTAMLARAWSRINIDARVWILTFGAVDVPESCSRPVPSQSAAWGAGRVMANEMPGLRVRLLDIHPHSSGELPVQDVLRELTASVRDTEVVLAGGKRFLPRLLPFAHEAGDNEAESDVLQKVRLDFDVPGNLDGLSWSKAPRRLPGPEEVEIETRAIGLNFRDVMLALGYLPGEALEDGFSGPHLGLECAGRIVARGSDVQGLQVGDKVMALAGACFSSHVTAPHYAVFPKPAHWSFQEAATAPVAFFTAYYALKNLAQLSVAEKVLVHGGAGGVGLAAFQVAGHLGAEVFATAGTREKRDFLRMLGVRHVFDSRSLSFEQDILEVTGGQGVDAVLNCLAGESLMKSLGLLKPFGRFLELGKRDILSDSALRMRLLRQNISFFTIDIDQIMLFKPELGRDIFAQILKLCSQKVFHPLPHNVYSRACTAEAFKTMQQSRHMGKIVINCDEMHYGVQSASPAKSLQVRSDGSYLITGATGGLGQAVACRLVKRGAGHLILLSSRGMDTAGKQDFVRRLESAGADVRVIQADVADKDSLETALDQALKEMPPLAGVVHCAARLNDAAMVNQSFESFQEVLGPKALGAWNLHNYVKNMHLDHFIMFSSASTVLGNPGQSNYVAANSVLENLAAFRHRSGLPALAVAWGPISDAGMLQRDPETLQKIQKTTGTAPFTSEEAMDILEELLQQTSPLVAVLKMDWHRFSSSRVGGSGLFSRIPEAAKHIGHGHLEVSLKDTLKNISQQEGIQLVTDYVCQELAVILRTEASRVRRDVPVAEMGMDSLMGVELSAALDKRFEMDTRSSMIMGQNTTVEQLARLVYQYLNQDEKDTEKLRIQKFIRQHGLKLNQTADIKAR